MQPDVGLASDQSLVVQSRGTQRSQVFRLYSSPADEMASANDEIVIGADIEDRGESWRSGIPLAETYRRHAYPDDDLIRLNSDEVLADGESGVLLRIRKTIENLHDSRLVLIKLTPVRGFNFFGFRHMVTDNAHIPFFGPDAAALDLENELGFGAGNANALVEMITRPPPVEFWIGQQVRQIAQEGFFGALDTRKNSDVFDFFGQLLISRIANR